ncbi:MAG: type IV toxin-antitoxin system AbiEi family antitoxin domain-containing protein, partial [Phycisphaerae bacterium]|nr:type IV toxin-antitoxin system AbiEi family antitoxin domain-containing protein [Phycisphaerae bacterium]
SRPRHASLLKTAAGRPATPRRTGKAKSCSAELIISENSCLSLFFRYAWGMSGIQQFIDSQLARGRGYFTKPAALAELGLSLQAFQAAIARLTRKGALVSPRRGFYLILRPEDRPLGAPDPARWIDPLMGYLGLDYRISLLRAAAFHGSTHQAAMVFRWSHLASYRRLKSDGNGLSLCTRHLPLLPKRTAPNG